MLPSTNSSPDAAAAESGSGESSPGPPVREQAQAAPGSALAGSWGRTAKPGASLWRLDVPASVSGTCAPQQALLKG